MWREILNEESQGYDPPMAGDIDPLAGADFDDKKLDNRKFWASIAKSDTSINDSVRVWFRSKEFGEKTKLVIAAGSESLIDLEPKNIPLTLVAEPDDLDDGFRQKLRIIGKNAVGANPVQDIAIIELRMVSDIDNSKTPLAKLHVHVLPQIAVDLAIHWVEDTTRMAVGDNRTQIQDFVIAKEAEIFTHLNLTYRQVGVRFVRNAASGSKGVHYDLAPFNGKLNKRDPIDPELNTLATDATLGTAKLNLVMLRGPLAEEPKQMAGKKTAGWAPIDDDANRMLRGNKVYILTDFVGDGNNGDVLGNIFPTIAHEVGHALGLSTRGGFDPKFNKVTKDDFSHDFGVFLKDGLGRPTAISGFGLLWKESNSNRWLRHEDWLFANTRAKIFR